MRIIGGTYGGRRLNPPMKNWPTRPTTDIAREALYNVLSNRVDFGQIKALDLFGGTGAHTLEMISRGCDDLTYVDAHRACGSWLRGQLKELKVLEKASIVSRDVVKYIAQTNDVYDLIFADPPYQWVRIMDLPSLILDQGILDSEGLLVVEHGSDTRYANDPRLIEVRKYGQTRFSFFKTEPKI
jgi:N6-adenine-specific methylase